ncbi:hypothetical protein M9Y10_011928 [Tritrichomonas musculus]|uniref:Uncharacterized protein n=1 Tax=Tritrichomonas musculus TaxID=1915356 RepID=A0ABR2IC86_9EUKA
MEEKKVQISPTPINTRAFHAKPGESPGSFRPVIRSPAADKITMSCDEIAQVYTPESILETFKTKDPSKVEPLCHQITAIIQDHQSFHYKIVSNEEVVNAIVDFVPRVNSPQFMTAFTMLILSLLDHDDPVLIDASILFPLRDMLQTYPEQLLVFFREIPSTSVYARNAMVCTGIVSDIISYTAENNSIEGAYAINSLFSCNETIENEDLEPLLPEIVSLLSMTNEKALYYIIFAIINILRQNHDFVSTFYDLKIHDYIVKLLPIPDLTHICIYLIGNVSICEKAGIQHLIRTGTVQKLLDICREKKITSGPYWALSNCFESAPSAVIPLIPVDFLKFTTDAFEEIDDKKFKKDCAYFLATILLFSPHEKLTLLVSKEITSKIIQMLCSESETLVIRLLDAIGRVLFVGMTNEKMTFIIHEICSSPELSKHLENLSVSSNVSILNKAKTLICELEKKRQEL